MSLTTGCSGWRPAAAEPERSALNWTRPCPGVGLKRSQITCPRGELPRNSKRRVRRRRDLSAMILTNKILCALCLPCVVASGRSGVTSVAKIYQYPLWRVCLAGGADSSPPKVKKCKKSVQNRYIFGQFPFNLCKKVQKSAKKC